MTVVVVLAVLVAAMLLERLPAGPAAPSPGMAIGGGPIRVGLVADGDMFDQHERFRHLAEYVSARVGCDVVLVTMRSLEGMLETLAEGAADAAWLDPMGAVLASDRCGARLAAQPDDDHVSRAAIFVRGDADVASIGDLDAPRIAARRGAATSELFLRIELADGRVPVDAEIEWMTSEDAVVAAVMEGRADAGCAELAALPKTGVRTLDVSAELGEPALVVGAGPAAARAWGIVPVLLAMHQGREGRLILDELGVERFVSGDPASLAGAAAMVHRLDASEVLGAVEREAAPVGTSD